MQDVDLKVSPIGMDQWSLKPALASLLVVAILQLACELPGSLSFLLMPLSLLGYGGASLVIVTMALYYFIKKRPRRGASVLFAFLLPVLLWQPINWAVDVVHLGLTAGFGVGQLGSTSMSSNSDFAAYDWSVGFAGGPNTFLIHDVTDEIALPMAKHTNPPRSENDFGEECAGRVQRLIGHYYVCSF